MSDPGAKPSVPYWHLHADEEGVSHPSRCAITGYELKGVCLADPQWNDKMNRGEATVVFTVQPVGWVGDWHENPAPQWIIVLSGRWWIESMDGTRIEQGPGRLTFGEDQGLRGERQAVRKGISPGQSAPSRAA